MSNTKLTQAKKLTDLPGIPATVPIGGIEQYRFDIRNPDEKAEYEALKKRLLSEGYKRHRSWGGKYTHCQIANMALEHKGTLYVDMTYAFEDQWNLEAPNLRVHEWAQDYMHSGMNIHIRQGYYLTGLEELRGILRTVSRCGYCGNKGFAADGGTCQACVGSAYLKEEDLPLLVMQPILGKKRSKAEVSAEVPAIKAAWLQRQIKATEVQTSRQKEGALASAEKARARAVLFEQAAEGWQWLADRGISTENIIYYDHSNTFSVGWRGEGLSEELAAEWHKTLYEFPAKWEVKVKGQGK